MQGEKILFAADLDGTLLDDRKQIPKQVVQAVERLRKAGGLFTIATGRSITGAKPVDERIRFQTPVVLYNGAVVYDYRKQKVLWARYLEGAFRKELKKMKAYFPGLGVQVMTCQGIFSLHPTEKYMRFMEREKLPYQKVNGFPEIPGGWVKAEVAFDREKNFPEAVKDWKIPGMRYIFTGEDTCEFALSDLSKAEGIRRLQRILGAEGRTLCCIGDHNNDVEMLEQADYAFAVKNALEQVKAKCSMVVGSCNQGGVAQAIDVVLKER